MKSKPLFWLAVAIIAITLVAARPRTSTAQGLWDGLYSYFPLDNREDALGHAISGETGVSYEPGLIGSALSVPTDAAPAMIYFGSSVTDRDNSYATVLDNDASVNVWVNVRSFDSLTDGRMYIFGDGSDESGYCYPNGEVSHWHLMVDQVPGCDYGTCPPGDTETFQLSVPSYLADGTYDPASSVYLDALEGQMETDTWYMVTFTHDATAHTWQMFVNGAPEASVTMPSGIGPGGIGSACPYAIGNRPTTLPYNMPFSGLIDELGVWDRVLSPAEIATLYNGGAGLAYGGEPVVLPLKPGLWLAHEWMWESDPNVTVALATELADRGVHDAYVDAGQLDSDGLLDLGYGQLPANIIDSLRAQDMTVMAWIRGTDEAVPLDLTSAGVRANIGNMTRQLTDGSLGFAFDGVQIDIAPIPDPDESSDIYGALKLLLYYVRGPLGMGPYPRLSLAVPAWESVAHNNAYNIDWAWNWQSERYLDIAQLDLVDRFVLKSFDTNPARQGAVDYNGDFHINGEDYSDYIRDATSEVLWSLRNTGAALSIGVPAYAAQPGIHIGNLEDGVIGLSHINALSVDFDGISIMEIAEDDQAYMDERAWLLTRFTPQGFPIIDVASGVASEVPISHFINTEGVADRTLQVSWMNELIPGGAAVVDGPDSDCLLWLVVLDPDSHLRGTFELADPLTLIGMQGTTLGEWHYQVASNCPEPREYVIMTTADSYVTNLPLLLNNP